MIITQEDLMIVLSQSAHPTCQMKVEVLDNEDKLLGSIYGVVSGTFSMSADSDIRRTSSFVLQPTRCENIRLQEDGLIWLNRSIRLSIGLYNIRAKDYKYYPLGQYVFTDTSSVYDATTDQVTVNCADYMKKLDGSKNGILGALTIKFPAYEENPETGEVIKYNIIRDAVIEVLTKLARITKHKVDDIGEYKGMPDYNPDWETYRAENEIWNTIPFDQEFSAGCTVLSILATFRDLYPNYEMFFDIEDNTFVCQMVPSCYEDDVYLDNSFIQRVLISENVSVDMSTVRNVCEVWGKVIETDFYNEECTYSENVYSSTIEGYEDRYYTGDIVSLKVPETNQAGAKININGFGAIAIYDEYNESPIEANVMDAGEVYSFKIKTKRQNGNNTTVAYLLGQWQPHAINVLSNGRVSSQKVTASDGSEYNLYSKEYFQKFYNCDNVEITVVEDSPFVVQKIGEILDVKIGGEYDNITSTDLAEGRARWENWKNCRLTDNITITTALLPFLDVNKKISYKPANSLYENQYVIRSVSHDFAGFTTSITMYRFYPLYNEA